jgi:hypothetical protein
MVLEVVVAREAVVTGLMVGEREVEEMEEGQAERRGSQQRQ